MIRMICVVVVLVLLVGCSTTKEAVKSAKGKNVNAEGYLLLGEIETANTETGTPKGRIVTGRVSYKSRIVGISQDQKVPDTGNYKRTKTKSLFGTEEEIVEWDFTASSPEQATKIQQSLQDKLNEDTTKENKSQDGGVTTAENKENISK